MGKISHLRVLVSATFSAASLAVAVGTVSVAFFFFLAGELLSLERFAGRCFSCCSLASMSCCTSAVVTGDEDGDDGEEIVAEFGVGVVNLVCLIANHDFATTALENVLDEFEGDTTEPVTMGDHNLTDISFERSVQNSEKTGALPVDATRDARDDFVLRVRFLEQLDLAPEVVPLRGTRDPRVDDAGATTLPSGLWGWFPSNIARMSLYLYNRFFLTPKRTTSTFPLFAHPRRVVEHIPKRALTFEPLMKFWGSGSWNECP